MSQQGCRVRVNLGFEGEKVKRGVNKGSNATQGQEEDEDGREDEMDWNILRDREYLDREIKKASFVNKIEHAFKKEVVSILHHENSLKDINIIERNVQNQ